MLFVRVRICYVGGGIGCDQGSIHPLIGASARSPR